MIILDEREFLAKELESNGFGLFDFYENHQVMGLEQLCELPLQRRSEILLVDSASVIARPDLQEKFKSVINTFLGAIFFHDHKDKKSLSWLNDQAGFLTKIVGEHSLPMSPLQWTMLSNQLQFFWNLILEQKNLQKHIFEFSQELDEVLQTAEWEMTKAKKIHEVLIPKRSDEIKGVSFSSKYAVGSGSGGEFYDLVNSGQKVFQVLVSSESYLISSSLMGLLAQRKQKNFDPKEFLQEAIHEILNINQTKKKKSQVSVVVLEMDCHTLSMKVHGWGKPGFYSQLKGKLDLGLPPLRGGGIASIDYQMSKGEKIVVFSEGFLLNWNETQLKDDAYTFLKNHPDLNSSELLMEMFFQIKQKKEGHSLSKDAIIAVMEVNRHGIHKI